MIEDYYIHTFSVKSLTTTQDTGKAVEENYAYRYQNKPCFVKPISGSEVIENLKKTLKVSHKVLCSLDYTGITETDRIEWNGNEYEVVFVKDNELGDNAHKEIWIKDA